MSTDAPSTAAAPNLVDLIDRLVPPADPARVPMVPQTAGWGVLALVCVLLLALGARRYYRRWQRNRYRRAALAALAAAGDDPAEIAGVLRRAALAAYPRREVAGLSGAAWLAFLDRAGGTNAFSEGPGRVLAAAPYRRSEPADPAVTQVARDWLLHHRGETS